MLETLSWDLLGEMIRAMKTIKDFEDKIIQGDVLEVMGQMPDDSVHLSITSPPYNVGKDYDNHNDKMNYEEYLDWLNDVWKETRRVLVPGGRFCLNIAPTGIKDFVPVHHDFTNQLRGLGMKFRTEIVWYKQTMLKRTAWGSWKSPSNPSHSSVMGSTYWSSLKTGDKIARQCRGC